MPVWANSSRWGLPAQISWPPVLTVAPGGAAADFPDLARGRSQGAVGPSTAANSGNGSPGVMLGVLQAVYRVSACHTLHTALLGRLQSSMHALHAPVAQLTVLVCRRSQRLSGGITLQSETSTPTLVPPLPLPLAPRGSCRCGGAGAAVQAGAVQYRKVRTRSGMSVRIIV